MPFGQVVIGPPGSGKTTYCHAAQQFLRALRRPVSVVNLDPANASLPYECAVDVRRLITVKDVMQELGLGPNGAMLYCVEYLEANLDWLEQRLDALGPDAYVVFDLPGQVELSTNHASLRRIVESLQRRRDWRLVAVHLVDASHITDASRYVSLLLLSLRAMLTMEMPHVNVLSKVDLLEAYAAAESRGDEDEDGVEMMGGADDDGSEQEEGSGGRRGGCIGGLEFNLDFYTEVQDLSYLSHALRRSAGSLGSSPSSSSAGRSRAVRFAELNERICDVVDEFGLVGFETLAVEDRASMLKLTRALDGACGYVYHAAEAGADADAEAYEPGSVAATTAALRAEARRAGGDGGGGGATTTTRATTTETTTRRASGSRGGAADDAGSGSGAWAAAAAAAGRLEVRERHVGHHDAQEDGYGGARGEGPAALGTAGRRHGGGGEARGGDETVGRGGTARATAEEEEEEEEETTSEGARDASRGRGAWGEGRSVEAPAPPRSRPR